MFVKIKKASKVNNSETIKAAQIPFNPNKFVKMNKTIGKKIIERQVQRKFEYLGVSIA